MIDLESNFLFLTEEELRVEVMFCMVSQCEWFNLERKHECAVTLTEQPLVILRFGFEQAVNPLHRAELHFHVRQVTHHPVHVVGNLIHGGGGRTDRGHESRRSLMCLIMPHTR